MARLIFKCHYLKGSESAVHNSNFVKYMATRDGVEYITTSMRERRPSQKQKSLIADILRDIPNAGDLFEYEDYTASPTMESASRFITQALEQNMHEIADRDYYVKYIAQRPRVEKVGSHGLFTVTGEEVSLSQVCKEVENHTGNIWTPIISLRREDAARLCYDSASQWQALLRSYAGELAGHMKIHPDNFRWYAAYHDEASHPHVHMVCWSTHPKEGFVTEHGIDAIKSDLGSQIFRQDRIQVYERKEQNYQHVRERSLELMNDLCRQMQSGVCDNPELKLLLRELSVRLFRSGGKKVYGYLSRDKKDLVDRIVDELEKDPAVVEYLIMWNQAKNALVETYRSTLSEQLPLSQQKEFRAIKNMVIQQAVALSDPFPDMPVQEILPDDPEPEDMPQPDTELMPIEAELHASWSKEYKQARTFLFGSKEIKPDFAKAYELLLQESQTGNVFAMHDLGRMHADGLGVTADKDAAHDWYAKALSGFHQIESGMDDDERGVTYLRYRIGKMYMSGLGTEQDSAKTASWLSQAADAGHKYAQYSLASLYYRGQGVERNFETAFDLYSQSAMQENAYASYELGKMYRDGIGTVENTVSADQYFQIAFNSFVAMELEGGDDKLQYRIGQMLRDGVGTEPNEVEATFYFERSAVLGNPHAQYALAKQYLSPEEPEKMAAAVELLQKSADANNPTALYALGKLYHDGVAGVLEADIPKAVDFFAKSAERNNDYAAYALGRLYLDGEKIPQDVPEALYWLEHSAGQNNQFALYTLGKVHFAGELVPKNVQMAMEYLTRSATQGNQLAQYTLGKLYLMGKEVTQDRELARHWLELSAAQGNEYAQFFLDHFDEIGNRNPDLFLASTNLLRQLGRIFEDQHRQMQGQSVQIDRKRLRELHRKKLAQGHAYDDREPKYQ